MQYFDHHLLVFVLIGTVLQYFDHHLLVFVSIGTVLQYFDHHLLVFVLIGTLDTIGVAISFNYKTRLVVDMVPLVRA